MSSLLLLLCELLPFLYSRFYRILKSPSVGIFPAFSQQVVLHPSHSGDEWWCMVAVTDEEDTASLAPLVPDQKTSSISSSKVSVTLWWSITPVGVQHLLTAPRPVSCLQSPFKTQVQQTLQLFRNRKSTATCLHESKQDWWKRIFKKIFDQLLITFS